MLALEKKLLIIPIPWLFNNEQVDNALMFKAIGLAEVLSQVNLTPENLYKMITKMMENLHRYRLDKGKKEGILISHASKKIADELEKMV